MADHLTPAQAAAIDATVARVHAERADAPTMAAKYDTACARISEMHDEIVALRRRNEALEDALSDARAETNQYWVNGLAALDRRDAEIARLRVAWQSARRRAVSLRSRLRFWVTAWKGLKREIATLRAQLAATTRPHRAPGSYSADPRRPQHVTNERSNT